MAEEKKITAKSLSKKQYEIIEHIRKNGRYQVDGNAQNPTVQELIKKGICDWNGNYNALKLTEKGKDIDL